MQQSPALRSWPRGELLLPGGRRTPGPAPRRSCGKLLGHRVLAAAGGTVRLPTSGRPGDRDSLVPALAWSRLRGAAGGLYRGLCAVTEVLPRKQGRGLEVNVVLGSRLDMMLFKGFSNQSDSCPGDKVRAAMPQVPAEQPRGVCPWRVSQLGCLGSG